MITRKKILLFSFYCVGAFTACKKTDFLNTKPDQSLVVPTTLKDFQALLDNDEAFNGVDGGIGLTPAMGEGSSDNMYIADNLMPLISAQNNNYYLWKKSIYTGDPVYDWNIQYKGVFYANVVLDGLNTIEVTSANKLEYEQIKASAMFYRSHIFYQLAQIFAPPYDRDNLDGKLGIPLRLHADVGEKMTRATLKETYERIVNDLLLARNLLPLSSVYKTRPSKVAVDALLARVYQTMEDYDNALLYADLCLQKQGELLNYNTLNPTSLLSFTLPNPEIIFHSVMATGVGNAPAGPRFSSVDSLLYKTYDDNDLRKKLYFKSFIGKLTFLGYSPSFTPFTGLATDEIYLIRAECYARKNMITEAMDDLNRLMVNRWRNTVPYTNMEALDADDALNKILKERRKELAYRGLRWTDLRRLNQESKFAVTLTRVFNGITYTLPPNDLRYTYGIPDAVIGFNPDMPQNQR